MSAGLASLPMIRVAMALATAGAKKTQIDTQ